MPVEIWLTNSLEGLPYIVGCREAEEGRGQRFSRKFLLFLSNYSWEDNEVFMLSSYTFSCIDRKILCNWERSTLFLEEKEDSNDLYGWIITERDIHTSQLTYS